HERLRPGDVVSLSGPRNHFGLVPADEYLFLAGGLGITPVLPMVRAAAAAGVPWRVLYLGASRTRMAFLDVLATIPGGAV
ncbi:oxidoreductase, partial [Acinetobacter baumannii]